MTTSVAIVTEWHPLARGLTGVLADDGYTAFSFQSVAAFLERLGQIDPSVVIIDLWHAGVLAIEEVREAAPELPILVLSHAPHEAELVTCYGAGVDDYQSIETPGVEIAVRVRAIARRREGLTEATRIILQTAEVTVYRMGSLMNVCGVQVSLTMAESRVIQCLASNGQQPTTWQMFEQQTNHYWDVSGAMLRWNIQNLRKKLTKLDLPNVIESCRPGYRIQGAS